ncbi:MAG: hypothetical protein ACYCUI_11760 [Vulcanimicrobiaceae bacterium]
MREQLLEAFRTQQGRKTGQRREEFAANPAGCAGGERRDCGLACRRSARMASG